jgi:hypothetical protein
MAAGQGFKTFVTGEVLTAGDVNGYLMQGINVFANATARDAAILIPAEGQFAFTKDNNSLWYYDGAAWVASGATGDIEGVTAGVGISGGGTSGTVTVTNSMATAIDAKGDLVPGTGADTFARLAVGSNGTVLTADSAEATGLKWATVSGGGMTLLSTTTLSGTSTTVSSIDQTYTNLQIIINNPYTNLAAEIWVLPNTVNNINYGSGTYGSTSSTNGGVLNGQNNLPNSSESRNTFALDIYNYSQSSYGKNFRWSGGTTNSNSAHNFGGFIYSNSAITSMRITTNNASASFSGGQVLIYGVK